MEINVALVAVLTPVVMGIVQVAKSAGLPSRWSPLAAFGVGIIAAVVYWLAYGGDLGPVIWSGILAAMSAAGLYSGGKSVLGK